MKIARRVVLAILLLILATQLAAPDSYLTGYYYTTRPLRWHGIELERVEYFNRSLVGIGYQYGLAVQRFQQKGERIYACRQLTFADQALSETAIDVDYFNAKLSGLGNMRLVCRQKENQWIGTGGL